MLFYKMHDNCPNPVHICINSVAIELVSIIWVNIYVMIAMLATNSWIEIWNQHQLYTEMKRGLNQARSLWNKNFYILCLSILLIKFMDIYI